MEKLKFEHNPKLILSQEIVYQILYLHRKVGAIEWSGMLYYSVKSGTIKEPSSLILVAEHIFPMDKGTGTYTEYEADDSIIDFFEEVPDAMEMKLGHIHTHHTMSTGPSGTDISEIQDNLKHHNYYLSLIVNFKGDYTAVIGIEVESEGRQIMKDEDGKKHYWKMTDTKTSFLIDVDIELEPAEWFASQTEEITSPQLVQNACLSSFCEKATGRKRRVALGKAMEVFASKNNWNKKNKKFQTKVDEAYKFIENWADQTGSNYQATYELRPFLLKIAEYKAANAKIFKTALEGFITARTSKYPNSGRIGSVINNNNEETTKSKNDKVQGGRVGQLGFHY